MSKNIKICPTCHFRTGMNHELKSCEKGINWVCVNNSEHKFTLDEHGFLKI